MPRVNEGERKHKEHQYLTGDEKKNVLLVGGPIMELDPDHPGFWRYKEGWHAPRLARHCQVVYKAPKRYTDTNVRNLMRLHYPQYVERKALPPPLTSTPPMPDTPQQDTPQQEPKQKLVTAADVERIFIESKVEDAKQEILRRHNKLVLAHNDLVDKHNKVCADVRALKQKYEKMCADVQTVMTWATERGAPNADLGFPVN